MLAGKRFIVTGAASGLGKVCALAFAADGAKVVGIGRSRDIEAMVADADDEARSRLLPLICDVSDRDAVDRAFAAAIDHMGGLDGLVHAAGIAPGARAEAIDPHVFEEVFAVNMRGTWLTNRAAFRTMQDTGGKIINFGSPVGVTGMAGKAHCGARMGAIWHYGERRRTSDLVADVRKDTFGNVSRGAPRT